MLFLSKRKIYLLSTCFLVVSGVYFAYAQPPGGPGGGPNAPDLKLVKKFDQDDDGILDVGERTSARAYLEKNAGNRRRRGPRRRSRMEPGKPGPRVTPADVESYPDAKFYDPTVLRTLFLEFESDDWEKELAIFKPTDIEVPATLTVDGKVYPNVGVSFRGASSFFMIQEGRKRSLNLSIDFVDKDQRLYGYKSLNLLNCNGDDSMMSSSLYSHIAGQHIATPKVNHVKVVINGESWGIYVNSQQFNKTFVEENFGTKKGARWKVSGSPHGNGGLEYIGEDIEAYRERSIEIKSKDSKKSWRALINLCRVLNETPDDDLVDALNPILDIDGALWFMAVDVALVNSDGYWTRASDYNIYLDPDGKFHILPHDMNEAFSAGGHGPPGGGPPGGGPPRGFGGPPRSGGAPGDGGPPRGFRGGRPPRGGGHGGVDLDPLVGIDEPRMPLRSKLLKNPELQERYLQYVRTVAEMLDWANLGPRVQQMRELIEDEVAKDTRMLTTYDEFRSATSDEKPSEGSTGLRSFAEKRAAYLLGHAKIKGLPASP